jgi:hypothetical protein
MVIAVVNRKKKALLRAYCILAFNGFEASNLFDKITLLFLHIVD